jgi:hypothetical protein
MVYYGLETKECILWMPERLFRGMQQSKVFQTILQAPYKNANILGEIETLIDFIG